MTEEQWNEYLKRSKTWSIRIGFDLLHSKAYQSLRYGPAIKVLIWFYEKVKLEVVKKKRGKSRYRVINDGQMSFTYKEAILRGLTSNQFSRALKELCKFGFIDVEKPGSGLMGDYSLFGISQRWKDLGTPQFIEKEFPKSVPYGFRRMKQNQHGKSNVGQRLKSNVENAFQR